MATPSKKTWGLALGLFALVCATGCQVSPAQQRIEDCQSMRRHWRSVVSTLDDSCVVDADCMLIGAVSGLNTCEPVPYIGSDCGGEAVNVHSGFGETDLVRYRGDFVSRCESRELCAPLIGACVSDCAPNLPRCASGRCVAVERYCNTSDAGP